MVAGVDGEGGHSCAQGKRPLLLAPPTVGGASFQAVVLYPSCAMESSRGALLTPRPHPSPLNQDGVG